MTPRKTTKRKPPTHTSDRTTRVLETFEVFSKGGEEDTLLLFSHKSVIEIQIQCPQRVSCYPVAIRWFSTSAVCG